MISCTGCHIHSSSRPAFTFLRHNECIAFTLSNHRPPPEYRKVTETQFEIQFAWNIEGPGQAGGAWSWNLKTTINLPTLQTVSTNAHVLSVTYIKW